MSTLEFQQEQTKFENNRGSGCAPLSLCPYSKPNWYLVDGVEERHPEDPYIFRYRVNGKQVSEQAGEITRTRWLRTFLHSEDAASHDLLDSIAKARTINRKVTSF